MHTFKDGSVFSEFLFSSRVLSFFLFLGSMLLFELRKFYL